MDFGILDPKWGTGPWGNVPSSGLLSPNDTNHAEAMGLLGLAAAIAKGGTPSTTPQSLGGNLAQGVTQGAQMYSGALNDSMKTKLMGMQVENQKFEQAKNRIGLAQALEKTNLQRAALGMPPMNLDQFASQMGGTTAQPQTTTPAAPIEAPTATAMVPEATAQPVAMTTAAPTQQANPLGSLSEVIQGARPGTPAEHMKLSNYYNYVGDGESAKYYLKMAHEGVNGYRPGSNWSDASTPINDKDPRNVLINAQAGKGMMLTPQGFQFAPGIVQSETSAAASKAGAESNARLPSQNAAAAYAAQLDIAKAGPIETARTAAQATGKRLELENNFRKEFAAIPEVKNYKEVLPVYESVKVAGDTKAGDLNLVYGLAKMMDPTSVVRESEQVMVNNAGSLPDRLMGVINYVNGGGRLAPDQRKELMAEFETRYSGLKGMYNQSVTEYSAIATRNGLNVENVIPKVGIAKVDDTPGLTPLGRDPATGKTVYQDASGKRWLK